MACEKDLVKGLRSGVWAWWEFSGMEKLLFVDGSEDILTDFADVLPRQVMFKRLEKCEHPAEVLSVWRKLLKPEGRLLLGMNDRFGLRYFCGDRDPYTRRSFDGVTGTSMPIAGRRTDFAGVCTAELREMLQTAGWEHVKFYSVLPDLENCTLLYAEDALPLMRNAATIRKRYIPTDKGSIIPSRNTSGCSWIFFRGWRGRGWSSSVRGGTRTSFWPCTGSGIRWTSSLTIVRSVGAGSCLGFPSARRIH